MKGNYLVQNIINLLIEQKMLFGLLVILLLLLIVPFWQNQDLAIYDAPGHVSLVWYIKEFLWPKISGWNPFLLAGWPQGIFYPSFFHWLAATLSFIVGIENAIKLIISLAILAIPFAAYYAVKSTISEAKYHLPITFIILIFLAVLPNFLGIGFRGLFQIGLIPNFVSTPIFLIFIGLLHGQFKHGKFLWTSLILAILILTHLVAAISTLFYLLIYSAILWRKGQFKITILIWLIVISALLTSFFWIPFLLNFFLTSVSVRVPSYFLPNIILGIVALVFLFLSLRSRLIESTALSAFSLILLLVAVLDSWLITNASGSPLFNLLYPIHIYRFQPYAYLSLIIAFGSLLAKISWLKRESYFDLRFASVFLFLILLVYLFVRNPVVSGTNAPVTNGSKFEGRFIESFRRIESAPLLYTAQTKLVMSDPKNNQWAYGLFTDSTPNGPYLGSLIRSFRPEVYPEGEDIFVETRFIEEKNIQKALDLYGIKYVLNLGEVGIGADVGKWQVGEETKVYSAEEVGDGVLAEVTSLDPIPVGRDWDKKVEEWWDQENEWGTLPFFVESGVENINIDQFDPKTKVEVVEHNNDWTKIKLNIDSEAPQPVLIKFSYFPWWSAHQDGRIVQVHRAAPNLMLIFANGEVDLEFKEPIWLNFLYLTSATTFLVVIFRLFKRAALRVAHRMG